MKLRLACILGIVALAVGGTLSAQSQPAQRAVESSITGTVVSSSSTSLVIRDESGVEQTFDVDTSSTVPSGLMSGSRITVRFHNMDGGRRHVASVTTTDAGAPSTPTATEPVAAEPTAAVPATSLTTPTTPIADTTAPAPAARVRTPAPAIDEPVAASNATAGERLPDTASEMPLLALAGLMTLAAGLVLRELRRRDA